jgi:hypothetical protein
METRITKKSRFQIVKLEELVAPTALAHATAAAFACGKFCAETSTSTCVQAQSTCYGSFASSTSCSAAAAA